MEATMRPRRRKAAKHLTTGEAAKVCGISQQTIIKCFDAGDLAGFILPRGRERRIPVESLYDFMRRNKIPMPTQAEVEVEAVSS